MKTTKHRFSFFIGGFVLMALAHTTIQCEDYVGYGGDYGYSENFDDTAILKTGESIESAFASGHSEEVKKHLSKTAVELYATLVENSGEQKLKAYGEAFKSRALSILSEKYAEFQFTVGGADYTMALSLDEYGQWKIMRL